MTWLGRPKEYENSYWMREKVEVDRQMMRLMGKCRGKGSRGAVPKEAEGGPQPCAASPHPCPTTEEKKPLFLSSPETAGLAAPCSGSCRLTCWPEPWQRWRQLLPVNHCPPERETERGGTCLWSILGSLSPSGTQTGAPVLQHFILLASLGCDIYPVPWPERDQSHGLHVADSQRKRLEQK